MGAGVGDCAAQGAPNKAPEPTAPANTQGERSLAAGLRLSIGVRLLLLVVGFYRRMKGAGGGASQPYPPHAAVVAEMFHRTSTEPESALQATQQPNQGATAATR